MSTLVNKVLILAVTVYNSNLLCIINYRIDVQRAFFMVLLFSRKWKSLIY